MITRRKFLGRTVQQAAGIAAISMTNTAPAVLRHPRPNEVIRIGVVGTGKRGMDHLRALGYPAPGKAVGPGTLSDIEVVAVCDTYENNLLKAVTHVEAAGGKPASYSDHRVMLEKEDLDAVVIATSDHNHAPIAMDAARAGCDVLVEKCMANSAEEAVELGRVLEETGRILQVGYQLRQDRLHRLARDVINNGTLGKVHSVQLFFNRSGPEAAWNRTIPKDPNLKDKIAWEQFLGNAPDTAFDPHRFFEWRRYWDYSTGISGDLFSHALDAATLLMGLGIPTSGISSGGVYHWKDGRETPDTWSAILEYPDHDLSVSFLCSLSNQYPNHATRVLGNDASLELSTDLRVYPDRFSERYAEDLAAGKLKAREPMIELSDQNAKKITEAEASKLWLEGRGMTLTTRDGEQRSTTRLHYANLFDCMRTREQPDASYASSFRSTIGCHMCTTSYKEDRRVVWDAEAQEIK